MRESIKKGTGGPSQGLKHPDQGKSSQFLGVKDPDQDCLVYSLYLEATTVVFSAANTAASLEVVGSSTAMGVAKEVVSF